MVPRRFSWILLFLGLFLLAWYGRSLDPAVIEARGHYSWLSLLPAVAALAICFVTRNVIFALFTGILLAGAITGQYNIVEHYLLPSLGTRRYAEILLIYLWALGGLLGIWNRNGGALYFATWVSQNLVKTRRSAKFFTWLMGVIFHQGGTISTVLTGTTVRPVADRENVSHEELSYIVDLHRIANCHGYSIQCVAILCCRIDYDRLPVGSRDKPGVCHWLVYAIDPVQFLWNSCSHIHLAFRIRQTAVGRQDHARSY